MTIRSTPLLPATSQTGTVQPATRQLGGISLNGLTKSFGQVRAVRGLDLHIAPGETVALLGPNGAGKSTTIDMMIGLSEPDTGSVDVFGTDPKTAVAAGRIGAMLQTGGLVSFLTVRELMISMASLYPNSLDVDEAMELAGLEDFANQRTTKLSGGQTQRVRFGLALVTNSDLLVLDEPTVAMDVEVRRSFWTTMRRVAASGKTVVFATHYLDEADSYADRIVLMARGRIVADGPPTEIKSLVGIKTIRATLAGASISELSQIEGVSSADLRGEAIVLSCTDSDAAIRELLARYPAVHDIEIASAGLEDAFVQLTSGLDGLDDAVDSLDEATAATAATAKMEIAR
ncbi:ABC transporter ATP-binding protein [Jatrophihabitans sp. DSM 45814]